MKNNSRLLWLLLAFSLWACDESNDPTSTVPPKTETPLVVAPAFSGDSAYALVKKQVDFGPRTPNSAAHQKCGDFLEAWLKQYCDTVYVQDFSAERYDGKLLTLRNFIGSFHPERTKRILLVAHWDTRFLADQDDERQTEPILGANDGGSGVAVLLEIARLISEDTTGKLQVGVDIFLTDGEDQGSPADWEGESDDDWCLGTQYWAMYPHTPGYGAYYGILLDMVGAKDARFAKEGFSVTHAGNVVEKIWTIGQRLGYGNYFVNQKAHEILDDHYYLITKRRIPTADIIQHDPNGGGGYFGEFWHTHADNLEVIDPATLQAVGRTVLTVVYSEGK